MFKGENVKLQAEMNEKEKRCTALSNKIDSVDQAKRCLKNEKKIF